MRKERWRRTESSARRIGAGLILAGIGALELSRRSMRARAALLVAVCLAASIAAAIPTGSALRDLPVDRHPSPPALDASARLARLAHRVAAPWPRRQGPTNLFVEPLTGASRHGYGQAMLAETLMRAGRRAHDRRLLVAGIRALAASAQRADRDVRLSNPLELLGVASAYRWGARRLAGDPAWRRRAGAARAYLSSWAQADVGAGARQCFATSGCWNNYKLVQAAALLELARTGLRPSTPAARLADPDAMRAAALTVLRRDVPRAIGRRASVHTRAGIVRGLGVLSDQPTYPLAYHALSVAMLARSLDLLGRRAPRAAVAAFERGMLAQAAFAGPDGDVAYLGRAQGQSWALAATAYASESCARRFRSAAPETASLCAALGDRVVDRIARVHGFRRGMLAIVPRFRREPVSRAGLEHYARVATFNGLTGMFLGWAAGAARGAAGVRAMPLPLDADGAFADHDRARLAVVRHGRTWFAVHAVGPIGTDDRHNDFGLVAFKRSDGRRWTDVLPQRPLILTPGSTDAAGPVLMSGVGPAEPWGERFSVDPRRGVVTVHGGFRLRPGGWLLRDVVFRFIPRRRSVELEVTVPPGSILAVHDRLPEPRITIGDGGRVLRSAATATSLSPRPTTVEQGVLLASSYAGALRDFRRTVTAPPNGRVRWIVAAERGGE